MPTLVDLAELSRAAYDNRSHVSYTVDKIGQATQTCSIHGRQMKWQNSKQWESLAFYAALYTEESKARVLAYRGTDQLLDGIVDDTAIALGGLPPQAQAAVQLPPSVGKHNLLLTGHSLGGALAIIAAARFNLPAVTFNAPGVMDSCVISARLPGKGHGVSNFLATMARCITGKRILNIRIGADPVSSFFTTGMQPGQTKEYGAPQCGLNVLCRHAIKTCIKAVRQRADGYDEVKL